MTDTKHENWIHCPACDSHYVNVDRNLGDRGGAESLTIRCHDCENETTVVP